MKKSIKRAKKMAVAALLMAAGWTAWMMCTAATMPVNQPLSLADIGDESLNYRVEYKWGIINKEAGRLNVRLRGGADAYDCLLTGRSTSWADKIFSVRDTLHSVVSRDGMRPRMYERRANEGGTREYDRLDYTYGADGKVRGTTQRRKWAKGQLTRDTVHTMEADNMALDLLVSFYYMRTLPYGSWKPGTSVSTSIFSGKWKETLTIKYVGDAEVKSGGTKQRCHHIRFTFTSKGGKKSSDDIDAWITTTSPHIPLLIEGSLPIGKVRCIYQAG